MAKTSGKEATEVGDCFKALDERLRGSHLICSTTLGKGQKQDRSKALIYSAGDTLMVDCGGCRLIASVHDESEIHLAVRLIETTWRGDIHGPHISYRGSMAPPTPQWL